MTMQKTILSAKMDADVLRVLNEVEDPELGIGVVDVGLIYRAEWTETGIEVDVTTTVPSCPFAASLRRQIDHILHERFREASSILVRLVGDPPWAFGRLSEHARQALGWAAAEDASAHELALPCWNIGEVRKH